MGRQERRPSADVKTARICLLQIIDRHIQGVHLVKASVFVLGALALDDALCRPRQGAVVIDLRPDPCRPVFCGNGLLEVVDLVDDDHARVFVRETLTA